MCRLLNGNGEIEMRGGNLFDNIFGRWMGERRGIHGTDRRSLDSSDKRVGLNGRGRLY